MYYTCTVLLENGDTICLCILILACRLCSQGIGKKTADKIVEIIKKGGLARTEYMSNDEKGGCKIVRTVSDATGPDCVRQSCCSQGLSHAPTGQSHYLDYVPDIRGY